MSDTKRINELERELASLKNVVKEMQRQFKWHQHTYLYGISAHVRETSIPLDQNGQ